jgi:hypothetical protein
MADPISAAALLSAAGSTAAVAAPATATLGLGALGAGAGALGTMGAVAANPLVGAMASGALGTSLLGTAANAAAGQAATIIPASGIFANPALPALSGTPAYTGMGMAGAPPTFTQSVMSAGKNIQGLMNENPALTSVAKQAVGGMMQPPPPPQVLQAPPIQSGQFAPVDFMSLLSQKPPQMQRRTSLLG